MERPGLIRAIGEVFPQSLWLRRWFHAASLAHLWLPEGHRLHCRTTSMAECSFVEERRRAKVIPRFWDKKSCLKLVFATLFGFCSGGRESG